jgi:phage-related protein
MKQIEFIGDSLDALRSFPIAARQDTGYQLDKVQRGLEPDDWKPMKSIGSGVKEIRVTDEEGQFRVIYIAKLANAVYVLHCFKKKTQKTSLKDIELARSRYKDLVRSIND